MTLVDELLGMGERVLGATGIQATDSFLALGDAVAASEMLLLIRDAYGIDIDLGSFLDAPTVSELARAVEGQLAHGPVTPDSVSAPVAFSQEGMLWHEQFAPGSFNLPPLVRRYEGYLDVAGLSRSLSDIVGRHAPLRTTFEIVVGRPIQVIGVPRAMQLPVTDLTGIDAERQRSQMAEAIRDAGSRPFDLSVGPLFEPRLFRLADRDHVLVIRLHHLAFDDWAVDVFRRELSMCYRAHSVGGTPALTPLPVEFADFCRRQRRRLAGRAGTRELDYWRRELAGAPLTLALPIGNAARPVGASYPAVAPRTHRLSDDVVLRLTALARTQHCTLYMSLLAAFAVVARAGAGQDDLLMASVVANRNSADVEPLIACFTKKVLIRLRLDGDDTFVETMAKARAAVLGAMAHQDLAFETVVQDVLGPDAAALGVVPDISVVFQADTPHRDQLLLPDLRVGGYDTGAAMTQAHFAAGDEGGDDSSQAVWGGGIYRGTFLILSVVESAEGVSLVARGAFHPPAVARMLAQMELVAGAAATDPVQTVAQLGARAIERSDRDGPEAPREPREDPGGATPSPRAARVRIRGFTVEPARIEAALVGCPGVGRSAVVIEETVPGQQGAVRVVAYVVPNRSAIVPSLALMRAYLWSQLPGYIWPTEVVMVDALPTPGDGSPELSAAGSAPVDPGQLTAEEHALASRWADVLAGGPVRGDANYWQKFTFVEAVRRAAGDGQDVSAELVRRNRTLRSLAADLTATKMERARELH